jgi:hypothetical protein
MRAGFDTVRIPGIGRRLQVLQASFPPNYRRNVARAAAQRYAGECFVAGIDPTFREISMHISLQLVLQAATLLGVIVGFIGLIYTVANYRRQLHAQIFMKYTERYEHILDRFPENALAARFDAQALPPESSQLSLCVLKYLNLCSEEFYLRTRGYLPEDLWGIWEKDLKRIIGSPLFRREWKSLRGEFLSHTPFLEYVERVQAEYKKANAAHA